jgi:hypothetical protein
MSTVVVAMRRTPFRPLFGYSGSRRRVVVLPFLPDRFQFAEARSSPRKTLNSSRRAASANPIPGFRRRSSLPGGQVWIVLPYNRPATWSATRASHRPALRATVMSGPLSIRRIRALENSP